ncbi:MAG: 50S ribosomal protein L29 [Fimbriimonadaceae bacterium]|nr:50S ribosomal protein L29 [Fimbriimonadaceae bacterium]
MPHEIGTLKRFIREASDEDLERRLLELKEEHFRLRVEAATSSLENPKRLWFVRKATARLLTEQTRRRRLGEER